MVAQYHEMHLMAVKYALLNGSKSKVLIIDSLVVYYSNNKLLKSEKKMTHTPEFVKMRQKFTWNISEVPYKVKR